MAGSGQFPMSSPSSLSGSIMSSQGSMSAGIMSCQVLASSYGAPVYSQSPPVQMPSLQHQQSYPGPPPVPTPAQQQQMMSPTKSVNCVSLCKLGQETNQELVNRLLDVFRLLKQMQLPNGTNNSQYPERRMKIEEGLRQLNIIFRKLRVIYEKVSEAIVDPDENPEEVLVPLKGESLEERNTNTEAYKYVQEEYKQIVEQLTQKNRQIKEVIDKIRTIMWEINTMIVMRKT